MKRSNNEENELKQENANNNTRLKLISAGVDQRHDQNDDDRNTEKDDDDDDDDDDEEDEQISHRISKHSDHRHHNNINNSHHNQQQQLGLQSESDINKPKRNPFCSRCRNHGKSAQVKGHKRHCEYRDCQCEGCRWVKCRQIVSAAQIKSRRYQKQDEECGRRIEISPPVLTQAPNNDPATLIAKTLIGSTKHIGGSSKQLAAANSVAAVITSPSSHMHQFQERLIGYPSFHTNSTSAASAASSIPSSLSVPAITTIASRSSSNDFSLGNMATLAPPPPPPPLPSTQLHGAMGHLGSVASLSQPRAAQLSQMQASNVIVPTTNNAALSDAFNLFQFPASYSMLSASRNQQTHPRTPSSNPSSLGANSAANLLMANVANGVGVVCQTNGTQATHPPIMSSFMPGYREQFILVEEMHQAFGPLAIYAWLRSEGFNVAKVRALIECSKMSFDELLQVNGHSPLDLTSPIVDLCNGRGMATRALQWQPAQSSERTEQYSEVGQLGVEHQNQKMMRLDRVRS